MFILLSRYAIKNVTLCKINRYKNRLLQNFILNVQIFTVKHYQPLFTTYSNQKGEIMQNTNIEQYYTIKDLMGLLKVSRTTIDNKVKSGQLQKTKLGKRTLFSGSEVQRFLTAQQPRK